MIRAALLALFLASTSSNAQEGLEWSIPDDEIGRAASAYFELFETRDSKAAAEWERRYRSAAGQTETPLEERLARYPALWDQLRSIDVHGLLDDTERQWTLWGRCTGWNRWVSIEFEIAEGEELRIDAIVFRQIRHPEVASVDLTAIDDLSVALAKVQHESGIPGISLACSDRGRFVALCAGRRSIEGSRLEIGDAFHIGSTGKAITGTLVGLLVEDGLLDWSTTLGEVFSDWELSPGYRSVTVAQVAHHRGGLPSGNGIFEWDFPVDVDDEPLDQRARVFRNILADGPSSEVGEFSYSNLGYGLLGHIAERRGGQAFEPMLRERVFAPLGMTTADFGWPSSNEGNAPKGHVQSQRGPVVVDGERQPVSPVVHGAGDMSMSASDMLDFVAAHLDGLRGREGTLSPSLIARLHAPGPDGAGARAGYATGWSVRELQGGGTEHEHHGSCGGFYTYVALRPEADRAIVVQTNAMFELTEDWIRALVERVNAILDERPDPLGTTGARVSTLRSGVGDDLVVAQSGELFAADDDGFGVLWLTADGRRVTLMEDRAGIGAVELDEERRILFAADYDRGEVLALDLDSKAVSVVSDGLLGPADLLLAPDGTLYVSANAEHRIYRIDPDGRRTVHAEGAPLNWPTALALDAAGNIVAANLFTGELVRLSGGRSEVIGSLPALVGGFNVGYMAEVDGAIYVAHHGGNRLYRLCADGSMEVVAGAGGRGHRDGSAATALFDRPVGVCKVPGERALYVTDGEDGRLRRVDFAEAEKPAAAKPDSRAPLPPSFYLSLDELRAQAKRLEPLVVTNVGRSFLARTNALEPISPRVVYWSPGRVVRESEFEKLAPDERRGFVRWEVETPHFLAPLFATPLAYARAIDVLGSAGLDDVVGKRILDFGYGGIAPLRLLALDGAHTVGVDVNEFLPAIYSEPQDQGSIARDDGPAGSVRLVHGYWPLGEGVAERVEGKFDVVLSRNVLKRGYVHPLEVSAIGIQTSLGATDDEFLSALHDSLAPGGLVLVYNVGNARAEGSNYAPQDDLANPFAEARWRATGFEVLAFDADDSEQWGRHCHLLGWYANEAEALELARATYSLLRKP